MMKNTIILILSTIIVCFDVKNVISSSSKPNSDHYVYEMDDRLVIIY